MNVGSRTTTLQTYSMLVYRKAVHPEFFGIAGRKHLEHNGSEFEGWIFRGGHAARLQIGQHCVCEVVIDQASHLPDRGLVTTLPCAGERDYEERFGNQILFMTTMQTETLSEHLYLGTYKEMVAHSRESDSISTAWTDEQGRPNLSLLDVQRYRDEIHIQGYHLRSDCGLVLRTQSMFQLFGTNEASSATEAE